MKIWSFFVLCVWKVGSGAFLFIVLPVPANFPK
jgi:hypothetical protein